MIKIAGLTINLCADVVWIKLLLFLNSVEVSIYSISFV